ncbi:DUF2213 domain-containing protein [Sphingobium sp. BS19]|uniref:DUF2213 domain-containing protein n=1 Tax=Sphingobium sp. BS19 TaxID=3018973 RepID=UPI0024914DDC|nr:DUF2213 domain-containing protein [Sphingobium sp. BS19]
MLFADTLTLDAPRRTKDGFLAVRAKAARVGVYQYTGAEVDPQNEHGLRDQASVNVMRDDKTVFDNASARSFIGKPVTDDHPHEAVTADNWRDHARGTIMGAMRDGEYLAFDLLLTDAAAIKKVDSGKRELSNGYSATLEYGDFTAADGTKCPVRQASITGNHVALVDRGRAGPHCAIKDGFAVCDALPRSFLDSLTVDGTAAAIGWLEKAIALHRKHMSGKAPTTGDAGEKSQQLMMEQMENALSELKPSANKTMKMDQLNTQEKPAMKIKIGDAEVDATNGEAVRIAVDALNTKFAADAAALTTATTALDTEKGKTAALEKQLSDAKDASAPAALDKRVADRAALITTAKAVKADIVTDGKTDAEIRKAVVVASLGDAAASFDDAGIAGAFAVLTKDAKPADQKVHDLGLPKPMNDTAAIRDRVRASRYAN